MSLLKGKQIEEITQNNIQIDTTTIIKDEDVTNKEYVINKINERANSIYHSKSNLNMSANSVSTGQIAIDYAVIEFPISNIMVKLNGQLLDVGEGMDCYFSPDGNIIRSNGLAQKGDHLYWNSDYDLDTDDEIDLIYLVKQDRYSLNSGESVILDPIVNTLVVKYNGDDATTMNVTIDGVQFIVGNINNKFVWDIGSENEYTFYSPNESIIITVNDELYTVWFDGFGSLIFSIRKGSEIIEQWYHIGASSVGFNSDVLSVIQDSNGKYVIGGFFQTHNNRTKNHIVRLNQDNTVDTSFKIGLGFDNYVNNIIEDSNGKYLVVGYFNNYDNTPANYIIRLNQDGSVDTTFNTGDGFDNECRRIIQDSNGKYLVVGYFNNYNNTPANYIIRLNQDGSVDTSFDIGTGFDEYVLSIIEDSNGKYIAGGCFSTYNSIVSERLIRLNQDGSVDTTFNVGTGADNDINGINQTNDDKYIIYGYISSYNDTSVSYITRLNQDGSVDTTFNIGTGFNDNIETVLIDNNNKYVISGWFDTVNGNNYSGIVRLNQDGSIDTTFIVGDGFYRDCAYSLILNAENDYVAGGSFTYYNNVECSKIIIIQNDGLMDDTFKLLISGFNSSVQCSIKDSNNKYVYGGRFTTYNSINANCIVRVNQDGSVDSTFNTGLGFNGDVINIVQDLDKYVVVGNFTNYNNNMANYLIRLNQDGSIDNTFIIGDGFDGTVYGICIFRNIKDFSNKYIVYGDFTKFNNITIKKIIILNQDGSVDTKFDMTSLFMTEYTRVESVFVDSNYKILIKTSHLFSRLNTDYSIDNTFIPNFDAGSTHIIGISELSNGNLILYGSFNEIQSEYNTNRTLCLNQDGSINTEFNIGKGFDNNYSTNIKGIIGDQNGKLLMYGDFNEFNGNINNKNIIRLNQDGSKDTTFDSSMTLRYGNIYSIAKSNQGDYLISHAGVNYHNTQGIVIITNGEFTNPFDFQDINNNIVIKSIILDSNNKYVVVGNFSTYNGISVTYGIIRINQDGSRDTDFNMNYNFTGSVITQIIEDKNNKYLIRFDKSPYIVRINQDGSTDTTFNIGSGFNGTINYIYIDSNGNYLVGGSFTVYNGITVNRIVRLNNDGSRDTSFVTGTGFNYSIKYINEFNNNEYIVCCDNTSQYNNTYVGYSCIINKSGVLNTTFSSKIRDYQIFATYQDNDKYVITIKNTYYVNDYIFNGFIRLNNDGSIDETFNFNKCVGNDYTQMPNKILQDNDGNYVLCGDFVELYGEKCGNVIIIDQQGRLVSTYWINGMIIDFIKNGDSFVYVGHFSSFLLEAPKNISKITSTGALDLTFNSSVYFRHEHQCKLVEDDKFLLYSNRSEQTNHFKLKTGNILFIDDDFSQDTSIDTSLGFDGRVKRVVKDLDGNLVLCGYFTKYNDTISKGIIRLKNNGEVDATFSVNKMINDLIIDSDNKYLIIDSYKNSISRLNQDGSLDNTFSFLVNVSYGVIKTCIEDSNGNYIIIGNFSYTNGTKTTYGIIRINRNGSLDTTFNCGVGFNDECTDIIEDSNGKYVIVGMFYKYKNNNISRGLIRLNQDGSLDSSFDTGNGFDTSALNILEDSNNKYLIIGGFRTYKSNFCKKLIRLNQNGTIDNTFDIIINDVNINFDNIKQNSNGDYVVSGYKYRKIFLWIIDQNGNIKETYKYNLSLNQSDAVYDIVEYKPLQYAVVGYFSHITQEYIYLLKLNNDGTIDGDFNPYDKMEINKIEIDNNGKYLLLGKLNGKPNIVRLNPNGEIDITFNNGTGFNDSAYLSNIYKDNNGKYLIIGYNITDYDGSQIMNNFLVRLNQNGTIDSTFAINITLNYANCIVQDYNGRYLLSCNIEENGQNDNYLIRLNQDGSEDISFEKINTSNNIQCIEKINNKIYAGGYFTNIKYGNKFNCAIMLDRNGSVDHSFDIGTGFSGQIKNIHIKSDDTMILGGNYYSFNNEQHNSCVALNPDGSINKNINFGSGFDTSVNTIISDGDKYILSGDFTTYRDRPYNHTIRINKNGSTNTKMV